MMRGDSHAATTQEAARQGARCQWGGRTGRPSCPTASSSRCVSSWPQPSSCTNRTWLMGTGPSTCPIPRNASIRMQTKNQYTAIVCTFSIGCDLLRILFIYIRVGLFGESIDIVSQFHSSKQVQMRRFSSRNNQGSCLTRWRPWNHSNAIWSRTVDWWCISPTRAWTGLVR